MIPLPRPRVLSCTLTLACMSVAATADAHGATSRPNVILILADDLGYGDLGCYNPDAKIPTPNLDRLAATGVRFTDAHTPSAVCTPTRYGLLTGRYCWRTRLKSDVLDGFSPPLIDAGRPTIASVLQARGYRTACFGKWHLGMQWTRADDLPESLDRAVRPAGFRPGDGINFKRRITGGPTGVGFDYYFGISASLDMPPYCWIENELPVGNLTRRMPDKNEIYLSVARGLWADGFELNQVMPTLKAKTTGWIEEQHRRDPEQPFFLYLPLTGPHLPVVPSEAFAEKSPAGPYGDFLMEVDDYIGAVMDTINRIGAQENTIVIFTSDNGGLYHLWSPQEMDDLAGYRPTPRALALDKFGHHSNGRLRGTKADIYEGGHRVPLIVHWPAGVKRSVTDAPVELTDLFATIADITGAVLPAGVAPDSFSFRPVLAQAGDRAARPFLVHHSLEGTFAVREGDWKYVESRGSGGFSIPRSIPVGAGEAAGQLYNLKEDGQETKNLYLAEPARVRHFEELLREIKSTDSLRSLRPTGGNK
jgi:arylsulfatase A-like enzyme